MSDDDLANVWTRSLADLADMHIEPHQRAWLQLTRPLGLVENTALIAAPNEFVKEQLETRLRALITNALSRELARPIQLAVTVDPTATADLGPAASSGQPGGLTDALDDHVAEPSSAPLGESGSADGFPDPRNGHYANGVPGPVGFDLDASRPSPQPTPFRRESRDGSAPNLPGAATPLAGAGNSIGTVHRQPGPQGPAGQL